MPTAGPRPRSGVCSSGPLRMTSCTFLRGGDHLRLNDGWFGYGLNRCDEALLVNYAIGVGSSGLAHDFQHIHSLIDGQLAVCPDSSDDRNKCVLVY